MEPAEQIFRSSPPPRMQVIPEILKMGKNRISDYTKVSQAYSGAKTTEMWQAARCPVFAFFCIKLRTDLLSALLRHGADVCPTGALAGLILDGESANFSEAVRSR